MPLHVVEHEHEGVIHVNVNIHDGVFREFIAVLVQIFILNGVDGRLDLLSFDVLSICCHYEILSSALGKESIKWLANTG
ncbi:hypothetical protein KFU94_57195 [Chloroflexi bacterium TSY]|nr:hypothetical protein [Chloroflexi bacterium TSY]